MSQAQRIDDYLGRLRRAMRGASPDVIAEAEVEIRAHIEDALAAQSPPTPEDLESVLDSLGPPEAYARDLALYMMVDRGYREWSLPHMARSVAFWALSTLAGAVVVLIFAVLYGLGIWLTVIGWWSALAAPVRLPTGLGPFSPAPVDGLPPILRLLAGPLLLVGLTWLVRWFVGQYVRGVRPHLAVGAEQASGGWARRAERRILAVAGLGLGLTLVAGFASGAYRFGPGLAPRLPPDFGASPAAAASGLALGVLLLAPVIGVLWSVLVERDAAD